MRTSTIVGFAFELLHLVEISLGRERHLQNNGITYETYRVPLVSNRAVF